MILKKCLATLLCLPALCMAETCLTNQQPIELGSNLAKVEANCGTNHSNDAHQIPIIENQQVTRYYYLTQFMHVNEISPGEKASVPTPPSIIRIVVEFNKDNQVNLLHIYTPTMLDMNNEAIDMLGYAVERGKAQQEVIDMLGKPSNMDQTIQAITVGHQTETVWTYQKDNQSQSFYFTNGILTRIQ